MKALLGMLGGILFAGAGLLFANLALANASKSLWGYGWLTFIAFYIAGLAITMTAPNIREAMRRLAVATGALLCGSALLIFVLSGSTLALGAVGIVGGANIAILLVIGLAMLAGGLFGGKVDH